MSMADNIATLSPRYAVTWDESKKPRKPQLPDPPDHHDAPAQCAWLTAVLALATSHPIVAARLLGGAIVELDRFDAPTLTFEPPGVLANGTKLTEALVFQMQRGDGDPFPWSLAQAQTIARVVSRLCEDHRARSVAEEAHAALAMLMQVADPVEGSTRGTSGQRHDAAVALRPPTDLSGRTVWLRYLIAADDEIVVRVGDLNDIARRLHGSLRHGWLDGAMSALGFERITLDGRDAAGHHARCFAYRGQLPHLDADEGRPHDHTVPHS